ncbi:TadE/TadG family type IV pilus assembly protein [Magnetospirillum sp. SS-4]|uniref:TadE/TadG family type IV pilus assembly protein n=1 Tax=Magnetospirillum sp. SS-4 TaxID=2681465 RepID=UPI00137EDBE4|nr:TadE/TadG family type IV pilus assembly protein [Magnetospirillum sp. SS-4]CAA7617006.1 Flp pilus assembly protein TadG [Magnetospirillum sp. SS-4]
MTHHSPGPLSRLIHCRRGNIAVMFALSLIPVIASVGFGVDITRAYAVKSRMAAALDAAALAVGSSTGTNAQLQQVGSNFFNANFPSGTLDATPAVTFTVNGDIITGSASASIPTVIMNVVGINQLNVAATSTVMRKITGLELAMVLDNTGSMTSNNNIGALRDAAASLLDILFGSYTTHPTLKIALVPFSAAVNPGNEAAGLVGAGSAHAPTDPAGWKGCVMERASPHTHADVPASTALWARYVWQPAVDNNYSLSNPSSILSNPSYGNGSTGPNLGCPTAITPLTNVKAELQGAVNAMAAWSRGGTLGDIGMAWGLRALSPEPPFTQGQPWGTKDLTKAVILMTDGNNEVYKLPGAAGPNNKNTAVNSDFTAYGRLDELGMVGATTISGARTIIDGRLATLCAEMKAKNIVVYTVTFTSNLASSTKDIYRNCASDPQKYFDSPTQADLKSAFAAIAVQLSNLRITQ